ncbi:MAG: hypothetical protein CXR30_14315 [Geobacter sp.]|nr:MAG: hypothetical protein CXR30_14315 [Geobacter sp.]
MPAATRTQEIACQQVLVDDSSVFSIQWSIFPPRIATELTPEMLLNRYLAYIRRCTATIIRPCPTPAGMEFRLFASRVSLISFLPAAMEDDCLVLRIRGGLLVQPRQCDRGEMRFGVVALPEGVRVSLQLSDYCPLLLGSSSPSVVRRWLYSLTQAFIHRLVTVRFLVLLYRELAGSACLVKVVPARIREGRPV